jgi:hypothetical protein
VRSARGPDRSDRRAADRPVWKGTCDNVSHQRERHGVPIAFKGKLHGCREGTNWVPHQAIRTLTARPSACGHRIGRVGSGGAVLQFGHRPIARAR